MKKKLINLFIALGFIVAALSGAYILLVPEYIKEQIPQLNWLVALTAGGASGGFASIALYLKTMLSTQDLRVDDKVEKSVKAVNQIIDLVINLREQYKEIEIVLNELLVENNKDNINDEALTANLSELIKLVKVDLNSKLTNPLIDKDAAEQIRGVLNGKDDIKA